MKQTQCQRVLQYMKEHGSITPAEAFNNLNIYRLGARIFDLRRDGHVIRTENVIKKNAAGETVKYAVYSLEGVDSKNYSR